MSDFLHARIRATGLLIAAGTVFTAASVAGFAGRYWWILDLASHFRVQYLVALLVVVLGLTTARAFRAAGAFLVMAGINFAVVIPLYYGVNSSVSVAGAPVRAMLMNVHTANTDHEAVLNSITTHDPDIVIVEEVNQRWIDALQPLTELYPYSVSRPREDNFGIALFSKRFITDSEVISLSDVGEPSILAHIRLNGGELALLGTHALPPISARYSAIRNAQLTAIADIAATSAMPLLVLGDLNVSPWSYHFERLIQRSGLRNASTGRGIQSTWPTHIWPARIPIDHCLYSSGIQVLSKFIGDNIGSDHYPVIVDFVLE